VRSRLRARASRIVAFASLPALWVLSACGAGDRPLAVVDPEAVPAEPTYEQVAAILDRSCVPCHHSARNEPLVGVSTLREEGEDDSVPYDDCDSIVHGVEGILRTAVDGSSMPPGAWPRLDEYERLVIRRWADRGAPAPCAP